MVGISLPETGTSADGIVETSLHNLQLLRAGEQMKLLGIICEHTHTQANVLCP